MPRILLGLYVVAGGALVLWPGGIHGVDLSSELNATGLGWVTYVQLESFSNVLLFVPLGSLIALMVPTRAWWILALALVALSCSIELVQHFFIPGRIGSLADVAANTTGAVAGILLAGLIRGIAFLVRRPRQTSQEDDAR